MKHYFIVLKKQQGELLNAYSIVDEEILATIDPNTIKAKVEVEDKQYSKEELEKLRDSLI